MALFPQFSGISCPNRFKHKQTIRTTQISLKAQQSPGAATTDYLSDSVADMIWDNPCRPFVAPAPSITELYCRATRPTPLLIISIINVAASSYCSIDFLNRPGLYRLQSQLTHARAILRLIKVIVQSQPHRVCKSYTTMFTIDGLHCFRLCVIAALTTMIAVLNAVELL